MRHATLSPSRYGWTKLIFFESCLRLKPPWKPSQLYGTRKERQNNIRPKYSQRTVCDRKSTGWSICYVVKSYNTLAHAILSVYKIPIRSFYIDWITYFTHYICFITYKPTLDCTDGGIKKNNRIFFRLFALFIIKKKKPSRSSACKNVLRYGLWWRDDVSDNNNNNNNMNAYFEIILYIYITRWRQTSFACGGSTRRQQKEEKKKPYAFRLSWLAPGVDGLAGIRLGVRGRYN